MVAVVLSVSACTGSVPPKGWSGPAASDDNVFVGSRNGKVVALKASDGSLLWEFPPEGGERIQGIYGVPAVNGNLVIAAAYGIGTSPTADNGRVYALSADKGKMEWQYPMQGQVQAFVGSPVATGGVLFIGSSDGNLYALDAASGAEKWRFTTGNKVWSTPAVSGGVIYFGSTDRNLYAVDISSGKKLWAFTSQGSVMATPLVQDNTIYVGSFDRNLYALDMNGKEKWRFQGGSWFWSRPVVVGNTVFAANLDSKLYVLDASDGRKIKELELAGGVRADLLAADSAIFIGSESGDVYRLGVEQQNLKVFFNVGAGVQIAAPLAAQGGKLYIHAQNGTVYALDIKSGDKLWTAPLVK